VGWVTEAFKQPIKALLQAGKRVRAKVIIGGQKWTANNDLGLLCRWAKGVISFDEAKVKNDSTESEKEIFDSDSNYHSL
jgi:hypothetical protein